MYLNISTSQWKYSFLKVCPAVFQGHFSSLSKTLPGKFRCQSSSLWAQADEAPWLNGSSLQVSAARAVCVPGTLGLECMCPPPQKPWYFGSLVSSCWIFPVLIMWGRGRKSCSIIVFVLVVFEFLLHFLHHVSLQKKMTWYKWSSTFFMLLSSEFTTDLYFLLLNNTYIL